MQRKKSLHNSKLEVINQIQLTGLKIKEELRTGTRISLKVKMKQMPRYILLTVILSPNAIGGTEIKSVYKLNWLRLLFNAGIFVGISFILILLNILLIRESFIEGFVLLILNTFLIIGLYYKLIHISNEVLTGWMSTVKK